MSASAGLKTAAMAACAIHHGDFCDLISEPDAATQSALACYRRAADMLKEVGAEHGRFELLARAWLGSGCCFFQHKQNASAIKCFKKALKHLQSMRRNSTSTDRVTIMASLHIRTLLSPSEQTAWLLSTIRQTCAALTLETAFVRLNTLLLGPVTVLSLQDIDACGNALLNDRPCNGHGDDHPALALAAPVETMLLTEPLPEVVPYTVKAFWLSHLLQRRADLGLPPAPHCHQAFMLCKTLAELDFYLDGTPLHHKPDPPMLPLMLSTAYCHVRNLRTGRPDCGSYQILFGNFNPYFAKRGMAMDWDTMLERYMLLDKNTRDDMAVGELLQALLPEFGAQLTV